MSNKETLISTVIGAGFVDGVLAHVQMMTGQDVSETGILYTIMNTTCKAFAASPNSNSVVTMCYNNLFWYGILIFIIGVGYTLAVILSVGNWKLGAVLYAVGFAAGFLLLYG